MKCHLVSKSEFEARALELCQRVESSGEHLLITDQGKPALELRPYRPDKPDPREILKGSILWYDRPMDPVDEDEWEALK